MACWVNIGPEFNVYNIKARPRGMHIYFQHWGGRNRISGSVW